MTRKEEILIITENFPNDIEQYRGIYVLEQLREIAKQYDVHVVVPVNIVSRSIFEFLSQRKERDIEGIKVYYIKYPYFPFEWILPSIRTLNRKIQRLLLLRLLLKKSRKLHIVNNFKLVHGHEVFVGDLVVPIGKALGIPSIFSIHSLLEENIRYFGQGVMNSVISNLKRADSVIAVSNLAMQAYQGLLDLSKVHIVHNGFNMKKFLTAPTPENLNGISLLSVGNLVGLKKIDLVLKALGEIKREGIIKKITYRIIGGGNIEIYQELIREYGLQKDVEFTRVIPPDLISRYFYGCDIFVLPSIRESFGIVFLEAMYCGKPIICSSYSGISEIIENGKQGFIVKPDNHQDLKEKLEILMNDKELRVRMGEEGRKLAENYTVEERIKPILAIYASLAKVEQ